MRRGCHLLAVGLCLLAGQRAFATSPLDLAGDPLPPGAVARLGSKRFRQTEAITDVAFMPNGDLLTLSGDGSLQFIDRATGQLRRQFDASNEPVQYSKTLCVSRDGLFIATCGSLRETDDKPYRPSVRLWNAAGGSVAKTIAWEAPQGIECKHAEITPDGRTIISASSDGVVQVWDLAAGQELLSFKVGQPGLEVMALSPDGSVVATAGRRGSVSLWAWQTPEAPREFSGGPDMATSAAFSPDGKLLACAGSDKGGVRVWDVATGKLLHGLGAPDGSDYWRRIAFSPDGKLLCATSHRYQAIFVWDVATGEELRRLEGKPVSQDWLAISPDSQWIAAAPFAGTVIRVWNLQSGEAIAPPAAAMDGQVDHLAFSPDDSVLFSAGMDHTVRAWETLTGRQLWMVRHGHWVRGFALSPDGKHVASSSLDDTVRLLDAASGRQVYLLPGHGRLGGRRETAFLPGGKQFLSWGDDMYLRIWDVATGKALVDNLLRPSGVQIPEDEEDWEPNGDFNDWRFDLGPAAATPDGKSFVLLYRNSLRVFDVSTGREVRNLGGQDGRVLTLDVSPDGGLALTNGWGKPTTIPLAGGGRRSVSPDRHIARVLELKTDQKRLELALPGQQAGAVAFNANGSLFAVAGASPPKVEVFDTQSGQPRWSLDALPAGVTAMVFSHDHRLLATALQDTTIIVWDLRAARSKP